jgi:hypothetical protein
MEFVLFGTQKCNSNPHKSGERPDPLVTILNQMNSVHTLHPISKQNTVKDAAALEKRV